MEGIVVEGYMLLVAIMAAGFVTGLLLRERQGAIRRVERLARPVIFVLLFVMGVGIGMDEQTMGNLLAVGFSSLGFAVLSAAGSMLVLALALPFAGGGFGKPASGARARATVDEAGQEGEARLQ